MIAVIADDLTGAAEIAGLGWRHGLRAVILRRDAAPPRADLVVYDSDSRLCSAREAARRVTQIARRLCAARPEWIYKKVDSVLRGNVRVELAALRRALSLDDCLLVPANPRAGRIIRNGKYFVGGQPIHQTDFRRDPTHPRRSADVLRLLGAEPGEVVVRAVPAGVGRTAHPGLLLADDPSPAPAKRRAHSHVTLAAGGPIRIVVGEASSPEDLRAWAEGADEGTLLAGGGEFFAAVLEQRLAGARRRKHFEVRRGASAAAPDASLLLVSGSRSESARRFLNEAGRHGWVVFFLPKTLFASRRLNPSALAVWAGEVRAALQQAARVAMAIGGPARPGEAARLGRLLAAAARLVLARARPDLVCVEGGATAALLWAQLGGRPLRVEGEWATGVVVVRLPGARGLRLVLKPGSYAWPAALVAEAAGGTRSGHNRLTV